MNRNLNTIRVDGADANFGLRKTSASSKDGSILAYFDGLEDELLKHIAASDFVLGCVAWLTSERVLKALAAKQASVVVQKEDFLRPDIGSDSSWPSKLRRLYRAIPFHIDRFFMAGVAGELSVCGDWSIQSVRCVGNHNRDHSPAFPRSHHKFVVFGRFGPPVVCDGSPVDAPVLELTSVWTGSFNFTANATRSFENAVVLTDPAIVRAYYDEYAHVLALSEPLDWSSDWVEPEWRIGS